MRRHATHAAEGKRAELAFQRWRAEILREAHDRPSLDRVASRALSDADVRADESVAAMIRAFIAEQEAGLRVAERARAMARPTGEEGGAEAPPPEEEPVGVDDALTQLEHDFHEQVSRYNLGRARDLLGRAVALAGQRSDDPEGTRIEALKSDLAMHERRADAFRRHVQDLGGRAIAAAGRGDEQAVGRTLRRLSIIHAARPMLLSDAAFHELRTAIAGAAEAREHQVAARLLIQREQAVAAEIRQLSDVIHRFYRVARNAPHDSPEYIEAERVYEKAVRKVQAHDAEWLAALILELVDLLEDWHASSPSAQVHIDRFLASVKKALRRLRQEIHAIERTVHAESRADGSEGVRE